MTAIKGHDAPYQAPVELAEREIPAAWIDYNGHMNVAYYTMAFDQALDDFLENELGIGETHAAEMRQGPYALQSHIHYLGEMLEGERFSARVRLIDFDAKRMHVFVELVNSDGARLAATCEQMLMNVGVVPRRSTPYPDWAQARMQDMLAAHEKLERPAQLGAPLGIRRKG